MSIILNAVTIIIESIIKKKIEKANEKTEKKKRRMLKIPDENRIMCCVESKKF